MAETLPVQPKRQWVGLTDEQIDEIYVAVSEAYDKTAEGYESHNFARAVETKLKQKNHD